MVLWACFACTSVVHSEAWHFLAHARSVEGGATHLFIEFWVFSNVPTRICERCSVIDIVPQIAAVSGKVHVRRRGERTSRRVGECRLVEVGVPTALPTSMKVFRESLVEVEEAGPLVDERHCWDVVLDNVICRAGIVEQNRIDVVVSLVFK